MIETLTTFVGRQACGNRDCIQGCAKVKAEVRIVAEALAEMEREHSNQWCVPGCRGCAILTRLGTRKNLKPIGVPSKAKPRSRRTARGTKEKTRG